MGLLDRITDKIAEKAAKKAFEVGFDTLNEVLQDEEKRNALLAPAWDYFDKRINLKIANLTSGQEELPGGAGMPEGGLPGGLGALASFLPPGLAQFAPLLGMMGGGGSSSPIASSNLALSSGNGHKPGLRR